MHIHIHAAKLRTYIISDKHIHTSLFSNFFVSIVIWASRFPFTLASFFSELILNSSISSLVLYISSSLILCAFSRSLRSA